MPQRNEMHNQLADEDDTIAQAVRAAVAQLDDGTAVDLSAGLAEIRRRAACRDGGSWAMVARRLLGSLQPTAAAAVVVAAVTVTSLVLALSAVTGMTFSHHPPAQATMSPPPASVTARAAGTEPGLAAPGGNALCAALSKVHSPGAGLYCHIILEDWG